MFFYFYLFDTLKHIFLHGSVVKKVVRFRVHFTTGRLAVGAHRENSEECTGLCINILSSFNVKDRTSLVEESNSPENISDIEIYYAKKEAIMLSAAGIQFPKQLQRSIASAPIIHKFNEKYN